MAWKIERQRRVWKPYEWQIILTAYGLAEGRAWTRKGAGRAMTTVQGEWMSNG